MGIIWEGTSRPVVIILLVFIFLGIVIAFAAAYLLRAILKRFFKRFFLKRKVNRIFLIFFFVIFLVLFFLISFWEIIFTFLPYEYQELVLTPLFTLFSRTKVMCLLDPCCSFRHGWSPDCGWAP